MKDGSASDDRGRSIWMRPARSARGPTPEHSTAEIARAAVRLADADGLAAVTMRAVAATIGAAPASLYRYVNARADLLDLMVDEVSGEYSAHRAGSVQPRSVQPRSVQPVADLLALAHEALAIYRRHRWLLAIPPTGGLPGPNALAYMEQILAILSGTELTGPAKLELIGLFTGAVRSFAQMEAEQRRAGRDTAQWQDWVAGYLLQVVAGGQYPHLAVALADQPADGDAAAEPLFDRAMTRILTGLLPAGPCA